MSRTWNSLNPSTLSGAIDVVVIKQANGDLHCSAFHIRFGKISLLRPSQKGVDFYVNGEKTDLQMKLGEGGEAFFVFGTNADVPENLLTSPVLSPSASPESSVSGDENSDIEFLDISGKPRRQSRPENPLASSFESPPPSPPPASSPIEGSPVEEAMLADEDSQIDDLEPRLRDQGPERIDEIIKKLSEVKIPSNKDDDGSVIMDMTGYKAGGQNKEFEKVMRTALDIDYDDSSSPGQSPPGSPHYDKAHIATVDPTTKDQPQHYVKTLRLTSDILKSLNLKPGKNDMEFVVRSNGATNKANIYLWDATTPVVISDIDGTITKSDALGHFWTFVGRDYTHDGVGRLFSDIARNGYNIMYLTSRSVGLADGTRNYLRSIDQDGYKLPPGPVILSPDRTIAALRREVIMRKPEIFKMACLRDLAKLYNLEDDMTPFYAGFGNRITDGLSYRSVGVPSTKIFTINKDSEVKLELLELTGIKTSYVLITDLVDQLFPPVLPEQQKLHQLNSIEFSDANFWKTPVPELSDSEDEENGVGTRSAPSTVTGTQRGLDWENNLNATFVDDDYDSAEDEDFEDSGDEDDEYETDPDASDDDTPQQTPAESASTKK